MINIAFEGMTNNTGGKETYIINVFNALDKKKYKCFFIAYDEEIAYEQYLKDNGAIVVHVTSRNKNLFSFKKELNIFFSSNHIDALWAHKTTLSSCEILSIAKKHNVPVRIIHSHCSENMGGKLTYVLHTINKMTIDQKATVRVACSDVASKWFFDDKKSIILKNSIDLDKFKFNANVRKQMRKELNAEDKFVVGHVGRFGVEKNHTKLLSVFKKLHDQDKNTVLVLCGDGEERANIERKIADLELTDSVKLMGIVRNVQDYLQAFDIIVMPSLFEGLPFALMEAQASGLKCVVSDTVSPESNVVGWNVSIGLSMTDDEWVKGITSCDMKYDRLEGYRILKEKGFDLKDCMKKVEKLINKVK